MRVSLKWLKELVDVNVEPKELADRLDMTGTAIEAVHTTGEAMDNVVIGQVVEKAKHPEADKLWITKIDVGEGEPRQIVCGAQNFEAGDKVPVALPGAVLPGGFEIKKAKLRGVTSEGMNCSARELGLGEDHEGLLILPPDAPVGMAFAQYSESSDTVLELEVTPNRPDCLSMAGVAREVAAVLGVSASMPAQQPHESGEAASSACSVSIEDPTLCPRYVARVIRGVRIGSSPAWLAEKVTAAGARPINNVVDVTNLVMFELGQPLHAFDYDKLGTDDRGRVAITVREARAGEGIVTLDGIKRDLRTDTLLICDLTGPVALAGVMGGEATEVSDATVNVLLESACFQPQSISRTSRSLGLVSEASMRFERIVDRTACAAAADRAAALISEVAGGEVAPGAVDEYPAPLSPVSLELRLDRLEAIVGERIATDEVETILSALGCGVDVSGAALRVEVPSFRPDLVREIDLVEEVLRVHGMERVAATLPAGRGRIGGLSAEQRRRNRVRDTMRAAGLNETMTYSFTEPGDLDRLDMPLSGDETLVELLNPMSAEQAVMRRTLLAGLLRSVSYNQRRGVDNVHLYEIGSVFWTADGRKQPKERVMLCGVLAGSWNEAAWNEPARQLDLFDGKGIVESLAQEFAVERLKTRAAELSWLQPGRAAEIVVGGELTGWLGEIHPRVLERFEVEPPVVAFEIDLRRFMKQARESRPFIDVPRLPSVERDLALVVDEAVTAESVEQSIRAAGGKTLVKARLFDVYRGQGTPPGRKSLAYALEYRAADRTLTAEEVDTVHERLVHKVIAATGGELRA